MLTGTMTASGHFQRTLTDCFKRFLGTIAFKSLAEAAASGEFVTEGKFVRLRVSNSEFRYFPISKFPHNGLGG